MHWKLKSEAQTLKSDRKRLEALGPSPTRLLNSTSLNMTPVQIHLNKIKEWRHFSWIGSGRETVDSFCLRNEVPSRTKFCLHWIRSFRLVSSELRNQHVILTSVSSWKTTDTIQIPSNYAQTGKLLLNFVIWSVISVSELTVCMSQGLWQLLFVTSWFASRNSNEFINQRW